jgi:hypothetical protein
MHPAPQTRWSPTRTQLLGVEGLSPQSPLPKQVSASVSQANVESPWLGHTPGLVECSVLMQSRPAPQSAPVVQVEGTHCPTTTPHWQME